MQKLSIHFVIILTTFQTVMAAINCDSKEDNSIYCGRLPTVKERNRIKGQHSSLNDCEWTIIEEKNAYYNCHSYAVGIDYKHWQAVVESDQGGFFPTLKIPDGNGGFIRYDSMDMQYGNQNDKEDISDFNAFFKAEMNWLPYSLLDDNYKQAKVLLFGQDEALNHSALKSDCNCGTMNWTMFRSKLRKSEIIEHRHNHVNGYGTIKKCYK